ncbi:MAG: hypothetical protein FJ284_06975 [Planctomycetes bacterium]|nr:hypothetical protein [Planctomycetota bacterium]MBM4057755.1 hypothetical protein [Planctomycetota bacterium]
MSGERVTGRRPGLWAWAVALLAVSLAEVGPALAEDAAGDVASFLKLREIDQPRRAVVEEAVAWDDAVDGVVVKVLQRLDAPANLAAGWAKAARPVPAADDAVAVADELLAVRGRATFVAARTLPAELAERLGRGSYDVVRLVDDRGLVVDVLTVSAPKAWPRWQVIDEPAAAVGLPISTQAAPTPAGHPPAAEAWPAARPGLTLAAAGVSWFPGTPLGKLGFDYGLFDTVVDGQKLVRGDTAGFYALLAAAGRTDAASIAAAAAPTDILTLINPAAKWLPEHRGDGVMIEGAALRATRVPVDDAFRREQLGRDHYWELIVFPSTPPLVVDGKKQNFFPIVCCVRDLSAGMPTGDRINETVRVSGFAFKRYAYFFEAMLEGVSGIDAEAGERQTMLVVGPRVEWVQPMATGQRGLSMVLGIAAAVGLLAILGLGILYGNWSANRAIRRARAELPARIDLPGE